MKFYEKIVKCFYAYFIFLLTLFISGCIVNFIQCLLHHILKPFSKPLFRKINYYCCYAIYTQIMCLIEWYAGAEIILYVDKYDYAKYIGKEHAYIVSNHKYEIDWILLGLLAEKMHCGGNFKAYIKKALIFIPAIGWSLYFSDNVYLERSFEKDKKKIEQQITKLVDYSDSIWLLLYPEGTRFTPKKYKVSLKIARDKGLPELKHMLTPRTRGFATSIPIMRNKIPAIYDLTISFNPSDDNQPTIHNIFLGRKVHVHIYLKRIPLEEVPFDNSEAKMFLHNMFVRKDKLQGYFFKTGNYFSKSDMEQLDRMKLDRSQYILLNTIFWQISIMIPLFYYSIIMILNSNAFLVCVVYGVLFSLCYGLSKLFDMSSTQYASTYGIINANRVK